MRTSIMVPARPFIVPKIRPLVLTLLITVKDNESNKRIVANGVNFRKIGKEPTVLGIENRSLRRVFIKLRSCSSFIFWRELRVASQHVVHLVSKGE